MLLGHAPSTRAQKTRYSYNSQYKLMKYEMTQYVKVTHTHTHVQTLLQSTFHQC